MSADPDNTDDANRPEVTLWLDSDIVEELMKSGEGWEDRVNDILRKSLMLD